MQFATCLYVCNVFVDNGILTIPFERGYHFPKMVRYLSLGTYFHAGMSVRYLISQYLER